MRYIKPKPSTGFPKHKNTLTCEEQTIMLECKMLKTSFPGHRTINTVVNKLFLCMQKLNTYSLCTQRCVKNVVLSVWNVNLNFS
jgi:hypothetical protein